jgi:hypothetical protein
MNWGHEGERTDSLSWCALKGDEELSGHVPGKGVDMLFWEKGLRYRKEVY